MNQLNRNVIFVVGKRAIFTVITLRYVVGVKTAELCFVLFNLVQLLDAVMGEFANLVLLTDLISLNEFTQFLRLVRQKPFPVLLVVIIRTVFVVVMGLDSAWLWFEGVYDEVFDQNIPFLLKTMDRLWIAIIRVNLLRVLKNHAQQINNIIKKSWNKWKKISNWKGSYRTKIQKNNKNIERRYNRRVLTTP